MFKFLTVVIISLFFVLSKVQAQCSLGLELGYDRNKFITDLTNRSFTKNQQEFGNTIKIVAKYQISNIFAIRSGIDLINKGYSINRIGAFNGIKESFKNTYVQMPFNIIISHEIKKINLYVTVGIYNSYWLKARVSGTIPNIFTISSTNQNQSENFNLTSFNESYQYNNLKDRRFEFGAIVGSGVSYNFNKLNLFFEGNLYRSITDHQKKYMINQFSQFNQTVEFVLGVYIHLNKHRKVEKN